MSDQLDRTIHAFTATCTEIGISTGDCQDMHEIFHDRHNTGRSIEPWDILPRDWSDVCVGFEWYYIGEVTRYSSFSKRRAVAYCLVFPAPTESDSQEETCQKEHSADPPTPRDPDTRYVVVVTFDDPDASFCTIPLPHSSAIAEAAIFRNSYGTHATVKVIEIFPRNQAEKEHIVTDPAAARFVRETELARYCHQITNICLTAGCPLEDALKIGLSLAETLNLTALEKNDVSDGR